MDIKVEKNVPLPARRGSKNHKYPWEEMEIGDSFSVPIDGRGPQMVAASVGRAAQVAKIKYQHRYSVLTVEENGAKIIRVWRVA